MIPSIKNREFVPWRGWIRTIVSFKVWFSSIARWRCGGVALVTHHITRRTVSTISVLEVKVQLLLRLLHLVPICSGRGSWTVSGWGSSNVSIILRMSHSTSASSTWSSDLRLRHESSVTITVIGANSPTLTCSPSWLRWRHRRLGHTHRSQHLLQCSTVKATTLVLKHKTLIGK